MKDLEDQTGDKAVHARTLPLAYGPRAAQFAATLAFVILAFIMTIPARTGFYRQPYGLIILFGVYPVIIFAAWHVWRNPEVKHMRFISNLLKFDMFVGLAAIWFGSRS